MFKGSFSLSSVGLCVQPPAGLILYFRFSSTGCVQRSCYRPTVCNQVREVAVMQGGIADRFINI